MPKFIIRRDLPGATEAEVDAAALRALACIAEMDNRVVWLRSYWDRVAGHVRCVYEAASEAEIREHAEIARIPCDEVHEVTELSPGDYASELELDRRIVTR